MQKEAVKTIQKELDKKSALLVASVPNRFYLTGFETSDGYVFITKEAAVFLIDFRYVEKAKETVKSCAVQLSVSPMAEIRALCEQHGISHLYVENNYVSMSLQKDLAAAVKPTEIVADDRFDTLLRDLRSVKNKTELSLMQQAQKLTDDTFSYIVERIEAGRTERDVMLDMEFYMRRLGSEGVSFDFIVVSGKNSSLPHGVPTDKKIERGDFVTMDFGAVVGGYHSDMTRTVAVGAVSDEQKRVYDTVLKAQLTAIDAVKSGVVCRDIDKIARDLIYAAGYEGCFGHGLGHSVGVEIHERPNFNTRCDTVLKAGTVMTVEPGIYLENRFGVRIEDMVFVTADGCIDLTKSPKELLVL